jgi:hypothetical protein
MRKIRPMMKRLLLAGLLFCTIPVYSQFSGNCLDLDGTNDMVVINSVPAFFGTLGTSDFTVEAWVYPRTGIFSRIFYAQFATNNFAAVSTGGTANIYFYVVVNGTTYSVATTAAMPLNQWTHVAARWTAATSSVQVFYNGVLQAGAAGGTSSTGTSGLTVIGSRPGGAQYFPGSIDEVRLWSEARTQCEISNNYMNSITGVQPNLVMNFDFNQGVAAGNNTGVITLPDNSGNSYNGTLTNFALTGAGSNWVASTATVTTQGSPLGGIMTTQTASVCSGGSFTFPDGTTQSNITSTATHTSTLTASNGCDSIINSTVNVLQPSSFAETSVVCSGNSYTFPDGSTTTNITSQVVYVSTLTNAVGCDSLVTTTVNVNPVYAYDDTVWICNGMDYTFPDGTSMIAITSPVSHTSTLSSINTCDSVITTYVELFSVYAANDTAWICFGGNYTFHDGTTFTGITSPTSHISTLTTINGCDSVFTTYVDFISVDTAVAMLNETLTANAAGAIYQWLDCNNGMAPIAGETNQAFTATVNGSYALAITENGCTDTSACYVILSTGITNVIHSTAISFYPNPANDFIMVSCSNEIHGAVIVTTITGQVVIAEPVNSRNVQLNLGSLAAGSYFIVVQTEEGRAMEMIIKN